MPMWDPIQRDITKIRAINQTPKSNDNSDIQTYSSYASQHNVLPVFWGHRCSSRKNVKQNYLHMSCPLTLFGRDHYVGSYETIQLVLTL